MDGDTRKAPRLVLVEDDERTRSALTQLLELEGYLVEAFANADAALLALREEPFDALVTDQLMPGKTGLELTLIVREEQPSMRCVVVSGLAPPEEAVHSGIPWLPKPVDLDDLLALLPSLA